MPRNRIGPRPPRSSAPAPGPPIPPALPPALFVFLVSFVVNYPTLPFISPTYHDALSTAILRMRRLPLILRLAPEPAGYSTSAPLSSPLSQTVIGSLASKDVTSIPIRLQTFVEFAHQQIFNLLRRLFCEPVVTSLQTGDTLQPAILDMLESSFFIPGTETQAFQQIRWDHHI